MNDLLQQAQHLFHRQEYEQSIKLLERLHRQQPDNATFPANLCFVSRLNNELADAIEWGKLAVTLNPEYAIAHLNLGMAYLESPEFEKALTQFKQGIELDPQNVFLWNGMGMAYRKMDQPIAAIECHGKAMNIDGNQPDVYCASAIAYFDAMQVEESVKLLKATLQIQPHHQLAASNLIMFQQYSEELSVAEINVLLESVANGHKTQQIQFEDTQQEAAAITRIGFVSSDFYGHTVGQLLLGLFSQPRPEGIEFYCYSNNSKRDSVTEHIERLATKFCLLTNMQDSDAARLIHSHNIDLLIDLNGHTAGSRLKIFSYRPAPRQASWLGFFASTGVPDIDYVLLGADQIVAGIEEEYSEKIQPLNCCQFNIGNLPAVAIEKKFPNVDRTHLTFGCFNNPAKINDSVCKLWVSILRQIPDSRLILKWKHLDDLEIQKSLRAKFEKWGLAADKLELRGRSPFQEMLNQYNEIDIALDPYPFTGAMTTISTLWMGVPVVTLKGRRPVSRQGFALLKSLDLEYLVAESPEHYREITLALAKDSNQREQLSDSLRARLIDSAAAQNKVLLTELVNFARASN